MVDKVGHLERENFALPNEKKRIEKAAGTVSVLVLLIYLFVVVDSLKSTNHLS